MNFITQFVRYAIFRFIFRNLGLLFVGAVALGGFLVVTDSVPRNLDEAKGMVQHYSGKAWGFVEPFVPLNLKSFIPDGIVSSGDDGLGVVGVANAAPAGKSKLISSFINKRNCDQVIDKRYYKICYNYTMKGAAYVGYELFGDEVNAKNIKKRPRFYPEKSIPVQYRTYPSDYTRNAYSQDRGHIFSDSSADSNQSKLNSVYTMANIIPQYNVVNRGTWIKAEKYERLVATKLGHVTVINGVIYSKRPQRIGKSKLAIPASYWKAIVGKGFAKCFSYDNSPIRTSKGDKLKDHQFDCAAVGIYSE